MQTLSREAPPKAAKVIIQITASDPVTYSLDGITPLAFDPGEIYEVPQHVARGMIGRNWARQLTDEDKQKLGQPKAATDQQRLATTDEDGRKAKKEKK